MKAIIKSMVLLLTIIIISCQSRNELSVDNSSKDKNSNIPEKRKQEDPLKPSNNSDTIYRRPDVLASFHGGLQAQLKFFKENLKFPKHIKDSTTNVKVILSLIVELDSTANDIIVMKGFNDEIEREAIRVTKLTKWNPGKVNGKAVRSEYGIKVLFK